MSYDIFATEDRSDTNILLKNYDVLMSIFVVSLTLFSIFWAFQQHTSSINNILSINSFLFLTMTNQTLSIFQFTKKKFCSVSSVSTAWNIQFFTKLNTRWPIFFVNLFCFSKCDVINAWFAFYILRSINYILKNLEPTAWSWKK